jgi:hypothetical protein
MTDQLQSQRIHLPNIHLVYGTPNFPQPDTETVSDIIREVDNTSENENIDVTWEYQEALKCLGQVKIGPHIIRVAGLSNPLPQEVVDCTIYPSPWDAQIKAAMRQHHSHLSLVHIGNHHDPVEKMIALYRTARAFINEDLLGVLNENAWTAHPPGDFLTPERIQSYREEIPFHLWVGNVKFYVNEADYWLVTKGHHIFDVPDLAYYVTPKDNVDEILDHFINIFYYIYEKDVFVTAGDTLEISDSDMFLKFSEVPEGADFLMGPSGTLVIEKINPEEAAR